MIRVAWVAVAVMGMGATWCSALNAADIINGQIHLLCATAATGNCASRITALLDHLGCSPDANSLDCTDGAPKETGKQLCTINTLYCNEPRTYWAVSTYCEISSAQKVSMASYDKDLTLTWWVGLYSYETDLCRN